MSNATTNVAAALTSAQDRKATRTSKTQAGKNWTCFGKVEGFR